MKYNNILKNFRGTKILVIGDLILDCYIWGKVNRISPEAPVPIVEVTNDTFMLGGAANVADNIIALGGKATVVGMAGNDRPGDILRELLETRGISTALFDDSRPTTVKTRVIAHNQQIVRFDKEDRGTMGSKAFSEITGFLKNAIAEHDAVIISDYKKGMITSDTAKAVIRTAGLRKKYVSVDPKVGNFQLYKHASLITPNLMEASQGSGIEITDEKSLLKAGKILMSRLSCRSVLITRGEEGMSLFEKDRVVHIPTVARHVYDVTGAGDTVIAAFTLSHASGATPEQAAVISNHAAGIVVAEVGTAVPTPKKLLESLNKGSKE